MGWVTATMWALTGGIGPIGGHAQIGKVELFDGKIRGTPTPNDPCRWSLYARDWTGIGISFSVLTGAVDFPNCDPCELTHGDRIEISRFTILIMTISKMTFHLNNCGEKSTDLSFDFFKSIGLEGSTAAWTVDQPT